MSEQSIAIVASLQRIKSRIAFPSLWTQNCGARNDKGLPISYAKPGAMSFCLDSALRLETPTAFQPDVREILENCTRKRDFITWQDMPGRRHADVLRLVDLAIAKAVLQ